MKKPFLLAAAATATALSPGDAAVAADFSDPTWPCIQRKQPRLSYGAMWTGPAIDGLKPMQDAQVAELVPVLAARRTPLEEAEALIDDFAGDLSGDARNRRLTLLFAGVFRAIDRERSEIVEGIGRYAAGQSVMTAQIDEKRKEIQKLAAVENPSFDQQDELEALQDALAWDTRIYTERQQSLTYVCESPVLLEQRVFALARAIAARME